MARRSKPFRIQPGVGGVVGRAGQFRRHAGGEDEADVRAFLASRGGGGGALIAASVITAAGPTGLSPQAKSVNDQFPDVAENDGGFTIDGTFPAEQGRVEIVDSLGRRARQVITAWSTSQVEISIVFPPLEIGDPVGFNDNLIVSDAFGRGASNPFNVNVFRPILITSLSVGAAGPSDSFDIFGQNFGRENPATFATSTVSMNEQADGGGASMGLTINTYADGQINVTVPGSLTIAPGTVYVIVNRSDYALGEMAVGSVGDELVYESRPSLPGFAMTLEAT